MKFLKRLLLFPYFLLWPIGWLILGKRYMDTDFFDDVIL